MTGLRIAAGMAALLLSTTLAGAEDRRTVILAGGCFWCVEADFDKLPGVLETVSGYTGGTTESPTYKQVTFGDTGHYEAVEITYDAEVVGLDALLDTFWRTIDPTDPRGQFCDKGSSYRTAIFYADESEQQTAETSKNEAETALGQPIVTELLPAAAFWPAEDYHQNYYKKNPIQYKYYRWRCGRDARLEDLWGDDAMRGLRADS